ncbi:MAG: hypothetical protein WC628_08240 [Candidatus Omnitrophota bacterium]
MRDKKIIILAVLSIAAVLSLVHGIFKANVTAKKEFVALPAASLPKLELSPGLFTKEFQLRPRQKTLFSSWGRNPFSLHNSADRDFSLSGIFQDQDNPSAIINEKIVVAGDKIEGCHVSAIKEKSVILNDGSNDFELRLGED